MTRVNAGIEPSELHRLHLIAEYREIPMVPAALRRSLRTKTVEQVLKSIPQEFTLDTGHVKFFYNKLLYLIYRYRSLQQEMVARGYQYDPDRDPGFQGLPTVFYNSWVATDEARAIVLARIEQRKAEKAYLYT